MENSEPELCAGCDEPMILVQRADGKLILACSICGVDGSPADLVNTYEEERLTKTCSGGKIRPAGYKYDQPKISQARKKSRAKLVLLCQQFNSPFQKEMLDIFDKIRNRNLEAAAGAVFLAVTRNYHSESGSRNLITLRQIASIIDVSIPKIAAILKSVEATMIHKSGNNGAIMDVASLIRTVLPRVEFSDPFTGNNITGRVMDITEKIIQLIQRRSTRSLDPNFITLAAGYLAWQSRFYYQKYDHGHLPLSSLKTPDKASTMTEFLELVRVTLSDTLVASVQKSYNFIRSELAKLLEKMPWIQRRSGQRVKEFLPQHLEEIIRYQELTCDLLSQEAESKRRDEPVVLPIIPKELTAEEEAALNVPELTEKDLPDDQLRDYLRSANEVESLKRWLNSLE